MSIFQKCKPNKESPKGINSRSQQTNHGPNTEQVNTAGQQTSDRLTGGDRTKTETLGACRHGNHNAKGKSVTIAKQIKTAIFFLLPK